MQRGGTESLPTALDPKRLFLASEVDNANYQHLNEIGVVCG